MQLSVNWFAEGRIDFELQKYRLLAYLQEVNAYFGQSKLYPQLSDVIFHYHNLRSFRENKQFLEQQFPKRIGAVDLQRLEIIYEQLLDDDDLMQALEQITRYAMGQMKHTIDSGTRLADLVQEQLLIGPVGLLPAYRREGYVLLRYGSYAETRVYSYTVTVLGTEAAQSGGLRLQYLQSWPRSVLYTYETIKKELVRYHSALKNPAFYCLETPLQLPLDETILPVARKAFIRYLSSAAD